MLDKGVLTIAGTRDDGIPEEGERLDVYKRASTSPTGISV
jgi:hypothetical protein